jgi:FtsZ-binding cell division protein ZapB
LVVEIKALQQSSSKLSEDRIYELKQRNEELLMDNDSLKGQSKGLKKEVSSLR